MATSAAAAVAAARARSLPSSWVDVGDRVAKAVEHGAARQVPHVAGTAVADVHRVGEPADDGDPLRRRRAAARRSRRRSRCAAAAPSGPRPRGPAPDVRASRVRRPLSARTGRGRSAATWRWCGSTLRSTSAHVTSPRSMAAGRCCWRTMRYGISMSSPAVTDVPGVAQAEDPVADDEALEAPLVAQHVGEQLVALPAPLAVDAVVGRHHRRDALVDDPLEVGEVHLVERDVVDLDVDAEAGVLHRVAGEVLHARHHVALQATGERGTELADVVRILAVGLLRPAPCRVAQQVDAHRAGEVGADRSQLAADRVADALLQIEVPRRAPGHRHRERSARCRPPRLGARRRSGCRGTRHGRARPRRTTDLW